MKIISQKLCENHIEQMFDNRSMRLVKYPIDERGEQYVEAINPDNEIYELVGSVRD